MKRPRWNHGATFKAHVALVAVKGDKMLAELAEQFQVHPMQITEWRQQLLARAADVFGGTTPPAETPDLKPLHARLANWPWRMFFSRGAHHGGLAERKSHERSHLPLPVRRQCQLLKLACPTAYYHPTPVSEIALARMRRIDERHLQYPFACTRMLRDLLRQEGGAIGRRRVATLIRRMGIEALHRSRLSAADSQAIGSIRISCAISRSRG